MSKILCLFLVFFCLPCSSEDTTIQVIPLFNRPASEIQPLIQPLLETSEQAIANHSKLIIKAHPTRIKEIKALINKLDTRLSNLSITVTQSRTTTAKELNALTNIHIHNPYESSGLSGRIRGRYANTENLNRNNYTQVVKTLEGSTAYIKMGEIYPVQHISIYDDGYGLPAISQNTQLIEASTGFLVTPRLSGYKVTLNIMPWSDKINNTGKFETQETSTTIRTKLGEWIEIGQINEQSKTSNNRVLSHSYSTTKQATRILLRVDTVQ